MYSSRTRFNTDKAAEVQRAKQALQSLIAKLPPRMRNDPDVKYLAETNRTAHVDIVHLIYRQSKFELESKDYEFSRATVNEHWDAGRRDMLRTIEHPEWLTRSSLEEGVVIYDLVQDKLKT
jgi:NTE family protein